jgi:hypothetical protein
LPIYIPLHVVQEDDLKSFESAFLKRIEFSALIDGEARSRWLAGKISLRLYLDGLDEVSSDYLREKIIGLATTRSNVQVVITSRDYLKAPWLSGIPRVTLNGLDSEETDRLVDLWFQDSAELRSRFRHELLASRELRQLMRWPLLATLLILVFRRIKRMPESRSKLYTIAVELMCGGWNLAKGLARQTRIDSPTKALCLPRIAMAAHRGMKKEFLFQYLASALQGLMVHAEALADDLVEDGLLSRCAGVYGFSHLSFQEFLTAKMCLSDLQSDNFNTAFDQFLLGNDWWTEVVRFCVGLTLEPERLQQQVAERYEELRIRNQDNLAVYNKVYARYLDLISMLRETWPSVTLEAVPGLPIAPIIRRRRTDTA